MPALPAVDSNVGIAVQIVGGLIATALVYAVALAGRLHRPPIELSRLAATLPIPAATRHRAKLAWIAGWWGVFVLAPAVFAIARAAAVGPEMALLAGATAIAIASAWRPRGVT